MIINNDNCNCYVLHDSVFLHTNSITNLNNLNTNGSCEPIFK